MLQRVHHPGAQRPDLAGDPALALHRARGRSSPSTSATAPPTATCSGCCCTTRATPSRSPPTWPSGPRSSSRAAMPTCAWRRATSCAARRTRRRRRSSPSTSMSSTSTSSSSAADRRHRAPARALYAGADRAGGQRPNLQDQPGRFAAELHERFASPLYAFAFVLIVLAFMRRAQSTRRAASGRHRRLLRRRALPPPRHRRHQFGGDAPAAAPLLYAVPAIAAGLAAVATSGTCIRGGPRGLRVRRAASPGGSARAWPLVAAAAAPYAGRIGA